MMKLDEQTTVIEGVKISELCYEFDDGEYYQILTGAGWLGVEMAGEGRGITYSGAIH